MSECNCTHFCVVPKPLKSVKCSFLCGLSSSGTIAHLLSSPGSALWEFSLGSDHIPLENLLGHSNHLWGLVTFHLSWGGKWLLTWFLDNVFKCSRLYSSCVWQSVPLRHLSAVRPPRKVSLEAFSLRMKRTHHWRIPILSPDSSAISLRVRHLKTVIFFFFKFSLWWWNLQASSLKGI